MNLSFKTLLFCLLASTASSSIQAFDIVVQNNDTGSILFNSIKATCIYGSRKVSKTIRPGKKAVFSHASTSSLPSELEISPDFSELGISQNLPFAVLKFLKPPFALSLTRKKLTSEWKKLKGSQDDPLVIAATTEYSKLRLPPCKGGYKSIERGRSIKIRRFQLSFSSIESFETQGNYSDTSPINR